MMLNSLWMVQNLKIAKKSETWRSEYMDYLSFLSDTQQSNTSERERNKNCVSDFSGYYDDVICCDGLMMFCIIMFYGVDAR